MANLRRIIKKEELVKKSEWNPQPIARVQRAVRPPSMYETARGAVTGSYGKKYYDDVYKASYEKAAPPMARVIKPEKEIIKKKPNKKKPIELGVGWGG